MTYSSLLESLPVRRPEDALDDADELHLGAEYAFFASSAVLAVRFGAWLDPAHSFYDRGLDPVDRALSPQVDEEVHYAAGFGLVAHGLQIDTAVDLSARVDTASLSLIYSF